MQVAPVRKQAQPVVRLPGVRVQRYGARKIGHRSLFFVVLQKYQPSRLEEPRVVRP